MFGIADRVDIDFLAEFLFGSILDGEKGGLDGVSKLLRAGILLHGTDSSVSEGSEEETLSSWLTFDLV